MPGFQQRGFNGMQPMGFRGPNPRYRERDDPDTTGEQLCKLFIGGLSYETTEASLKEYFGKWGEIVDCVVMRDQHSKRSRGFGFITFKEKESVDEVQRDRKHVVDSRHVETKRAMPRDDPNANNQLTVNKMFLGGLKDDTTEEMVRAALSEFGNIKEVEMINDKNTGKIKGFCFVTFDDYDPVDKCVLMRRIPLNTRNVEVKKAFAKGDSDRMAMRMGMGPIPMSRGGRGDYPGGYNRDFDRGYYGYHGGPGGMGNNYNGAWQGPPMYGDNYYGRAYNFGNHGGAFNSRR